MAACAFSNEFTPPKPVEPAANGAAPPNELVLGGGPLGAEVEDELRLKGNPVLAACDSFPNDCIPPKPVEPAATGAAPPNELVLGGGPLGEEMKDEFG